MVLEIERKRQLIDEVAVIKNLEKLGFVALDSVSETDIYYTRPDVDFMETVECLRIRTREGFAELTYKPPSTENTSIGDGLNAKEESNVILSGPDQVNAAETFFCNLGMIELARVVKRRKNYKSDHSSNITVSIDKIAGIGAFIETEINDTDKYSAERQLDKIERLIGIDLCPVVTKPYRDLVMDRAKPKH